MFSDRKKMFVDLFKWEVPVVDGVYEMDQFDNEDAVYLVLTGREGRHLGSVRLLPTTAPHLMDTVFADCCADGPPTGPDVWEITRLCFPSTLTTARRVWVRQRLATGLVEFGLLWGVSTYTCLVEVPFISELISMGWNCEPLGPPKVIGGQLCGAVSISITPETLRLFRRQWGCPVPILTLEPERQAA